MIAMSLALLSGGQALAVAVTAISPYTIGVFASNPAGLSKPDSIAFNATNIFVGYGNGGAPDGTNGAISNVIEYDLNGNQVHNFQIPGHNDGLRINPTNGELWALQNEDANATLTIINLKSDKVTTYNFASPVPHGGGYDDLVFDGDSVFISASNPANNPNTAQAIVTARVAGNHIATTPILNGNALATDVRTNGTVTLNLQDPDSMIFGGPVARLIMTSQGDGELILVQHPGLPCHQAFVVPLTSPVMYGNVIGDTQADDTVFASTTTGRLLVADKSLGKVYAITTPRFEPFTYYFAVSVFTDPSGATLSQSLVGQTNLATGVVTPIVTGLSNPGGMAFVPATIPPSTAQPAPDKCP